MIQDPEAFFVTLLAERLPQATVTTVADSESESQLPLVVVSIGGGDELNDSPYGVSANYPVDLTVIHSTRASAWALAKQAHDALLAASEEGYTDAHARLGVVSVESLPQRTGTSQDATQISGSYSAWAAETTPN